MSTEDEAYAAGFRGMASPNSDEFSYQRGQEDRKRNEEARVRSESSPSATGYGGGSGHSIGGSGGETTGTGIGPLFLLLAVLGIAAVALPFVVAAAVSATGAALLLVFALRAWPGGSGLAYRRAYITSFQGIICYLVLTIVIGFVIAAVAKGNTAPGTFPEFIRRTSERWKLSIQSMATLALERTPVTAVQNYLAQIKGHGGMLVGGLLLLHGPGILACAGIVKGGSERLFSGFVGYLRSLLTTLLTIFPALLITSWGVALAVAHVRMAELDPNATLGVIVVAMPTLVGFALAGGLIAALVLRGVSRLFAKRSLPPFGRSYRAAFFGLAVYGTATAIALYLFRNGDALLGWLYQVAVAGGRMHYAMGHLHELRSALWDLLPLQMPGLLLCAAVIASGEDTFYGGMLGFVKAGVVGGALAFMLLWLFLAATIAAMIPQVPSMPNG